MLQNYVNLLPANGLEKNGYFNNLIVNPPLRKKTRQEACERLLC